MTNTNTNTNTASLASRAAGLLSKASALAVVEKALSQAIAARRVHPTMAEDFGAQIGHDLPLKTKDFVRVVAHLLAASEKPIKGTISKKKSDILAVLAEIVGALTDTAPISLPAWALPKVREKKAEEPAIAGTLQRANAEAEANAQAEALASAAMVESKDGAALAKAVALVVANAAALTEEQREALTLALAATEPALM